MIYIRMPIKKERLKYISCLKDSKYKLLMFYSKKCGLCKRLRPVVEEVILI